MSEFFDSEVVQESLEEIQELQESVQKALLTGFMDFWEQQEQLADLVDLFEKQQLMYVRMKLSDDPEAKKIVRKMEMSLLDMGMPKGTTVETMFENMKITIDRIRDALDKSR